jgi:nitroreductase
MTESMPESMPTKLEELVRRTRSRRRFRQEVHVDLQTLRALVDLARLSASGANLQPLKYILSCDPATNAAIFPHLAWAGYLEDWSGPAEGERPAAYVVILGDTTVASSAGCDHGIAAQSIMLGAAARGLGGCIMGAVKRDGLRQVLAIPDHLEILLVLSLGAPAEEVVLEAVGEDGSVRYWRDDDGVHHVPKRALDALVVAEHG